MNKIEKLDTLLSYLTDREKNLLTRMYGEDLDVENNIMFAQIEQTLLNRNKNDISMLQREKDLEQKIKSLGDTIDSMREDVDFLEALEAAGVDNWEGYEVAQDIMERGY